MKAAKIREQTVDELAESLRDFRRELFDIQMKSGAGDSSVQPLRRRTLRREIARTLTVMRERKAG
jgi:ribosomal protein L29